MLQGQLSRPRLAVAVGILAGVAGLGYLGLFLRKASRTLEEVKAVVTREGQIPVRVIALDKSAAAAFEPVSSPAQFEDAVFYAGRLYLVARSGLLAYDTNGTLVYRYRVGIDLPAAPLIAMAVGNGSGTAQPELWIATAGGGLLSFDGSRFLQIRPENDSARALTAVLPLASGRILLGAGKRGVLVWDGETLSVLHAALSGIPVTTLAGSEADLWIGSIDRGVYRWHAGQLDHFSEAEGLPDPRVLSLAVDGTAAFAGTALGVAEFRDGRFSRVLAPGYFAKSLLAGGATLTVGTFEEGVVDIPLDAQRPRPRTTREPDGFGAVQRLLDLQGRTYALTESGLFERSPNDTGYKQVLQQPAGVLADGNISALAVDRAGRLWVGYFDRGLDILEPGFGRATHVENQQVFCVNRIVHSSAGGITAAGTANGLVLFDGAGQQKQVLTRADGLIANNVSDILLGGDGRAPSITVATPAGLTNIEAGGTSSIYAFHGLVNNHAYALAAAGSRTLVGTLGGLSIVDSGIVSASFTTANSGLKHNWITSIVSVANDWFIGTYGAGVIQLDSTGRWTTFPDLRGPLEINQNAMAVTDRAVYAGTLGKGLAVYSRASLRWTLLTRGMPSTNVTALAAADGYLYIGTDNGLVRVQEASVAVP